jgi:hypothetical protein
MKRLVILSMLVTIGTGWSSRALAQMQIQRVDDPPRAVAYWELGGNAMLFSGNVDVLVTPHVSVRVGAMLVPFTDDHVPVAGVLMVNYLAGTNGHYLETGLGVVASNVWHDPHTTLGTMTLGYRLQKRHQVVRAGFTPVFGARPPDWVAPNGHRLPSFGVSFGRTFD